MATQTSLVAQQVRLRQWAEQIRECQNRPEGMDVQTWCTQNNITKANYYYRLRRVRKACLEHIQKESPAQQIVPVEPELLQQEDKNVTGHPGLDISTKGFSVHVTESTPMTLLASVLEVIQNAE